MSWTHCTPVLSRNEHADPGGVDVGDDQVEALDRAGRGLDDPDPDADRAGGAGRGQLDDPERLAEALVEVGVEADLVDIEGLGPVDVGHRDRDQLELHLHGGVSFVGAGGDGAILWRSGVETRYKGSRRT